MFQQVNVSDHWKTMKLFKNKNFIISAIGIVLYAWLLGVIGIYGEAAAQFTRTASLFVLKYGAIAFGAVLIIVLPMRINAALERNARIAQEQAEAAQKEALVRKQLEEEQLKLALAKKYEEMNNVQ